jgi:hypothetical protein
MGTSLKATQKDVTPCGILKRACGDYTTGSKETDKWLDTGVYILAAVLYWTRVSSSATRGSESLGFPAVELPVFLQDDLQLEHGLICLVLMLVIGKSKPVARVLPFAR